MAIGDGGQATVRSYVAVGKEATFGTYTQPSTAIEALSCGFMTEIDVEKIDSIGLGQRGMTKRVQKDKKVMGGLEAYVHPQESVLMFASAMGGGIVSATHTASVYNHSLTAGNFNTDAASVCFNVRKGDTHTFRYVGGRCNQLRISAQVGEIVKASYDYVFKDSTQTADDISASLSISSVLPFTYVQGNFRYSTTEANAATTTAQEPIQGFELTVKNNIVSDKSARALGSNVPQILPATRREVEFKITQRFDTTTAYQRFLQATQGAAELFFQSEQIGSTGFFNELTIRLPKVYYDKADVELKDTGSLLQAEIPMSVVVDNPSTSTGRDIGITFRNGVASY
jgi:hypothetical protein